MIAVWRLPEDLYTPSYSFLADLAARRVRIVDLRPSQPKFVAEVGNHALTNGEPSNAPGTIAVDGGKDLLLPFPGPVSAVRLELLADAPAAFDVTLLSHGASVRSLTALPIVNVPGLQWRSFVFESAVVFDAVRITPRQGPAVLSVARLTAWGP